MSLLLLQIAFCRSPAFFDRILCDAARRFPHRGNAPHAHADRIGKHVSVRRAGLAERGLQDQTGIPLVHNDAYLVSMDDTYAMLSDLLAMPNEGQALADYCRNAYDTVKAIVDGVEKADVLYITGEEGLNVIARDSYHAEVVDMLCNNLAVVDEPSSKGTGNEVDMEQILNWDPSIVFFAPGSIYSTVADSENWQTIPAIKDGKYYEVPFGPYNWMGFPPSVQRILGMQWMAKVLYPEAADYDMYEVTQTYFQLFYHCDLTIDQYNALVANSLPAVEAAG